MQAMTHYVPTMFFYGRNILAQKGEALFPQYGKKAYIITSPFPAGIENLALKDCTELFDRIGIEYKVTDKVEENPSIRCILSMMPEVREFQPDFLVGVGGGSSMDAAKAVTVLLENGPEKDNIPDATATFYEGTMPNEALFSAGKLPVFAVPTTAGTGSEVTAFAVITNEETHAKLAISKPVFCVAGFLDGRYIEHAPAKIIHTGAMDALAHAAESYVNKKSNCINRSFGEYTFKLFSEIKDHMLAGTLTEEDYDKLVIFSNMAGQTFMRSGTTIPHGMGYALSTFKGVNHGLSCSITLGEYLKVFKEPVNQERAAKVVELCGFKNVAEMADYIAELLKDDVDITVTLEEIADWSKRFFNMKYRLAKHPEEITEEIIYDIYKASLKNYIVD